MVVLLLCLIAIGFYRGWFSVSRSHPNPEGNKVNVNVSVDKAKMKSDVKEAEQKVKEGVKGLEGKATAKEPAK